MHQSNQPKTTSNSDARDAAAQISEEAENHCINNDLFHVEPEGGDAPLTQTDSGYEKADAIWNGVIRKKSIGREPYDAIYSSGYWLAIQLERLTSADRRDREMAKKEIRELVKLGKGE